MFEQTVLLQVNPHLKEGETAEFFNGTLFVKGSEETIRDVYITLCNIYRKRFIQFSHIFEKEYAFDFVLPKD